MWVDQYEPARRPAGSDVIRLGDLVDVRVLGQEQLSARARVRSDGYVTLPFLGDVVAAGQTRAALGSLIEHRLKEYINSPVVAVAVEEAAPAPISVLGEVARPGRYDYQAGMTLIDVLALCGSLTEFGHKDRVFVLRGPAPPTRIRFDTRRVLRAEGKGAAFVLEPGDTVVAE